MKSPVRGPFFCFMHTYPCHVLPPTVRIFEIHEPRFAQEKNNESLNFFLCQGNLYPNVKSHNKFQF